MCKRLILFLCVIFLLGSCAQLGSPTGGPKDEKAPVLVAVFPENLATKIPTNLKKIRFEFDEYVKLDKSKKLIISPSLKTFPTIYPLSSPKKYIEIELNSDLEAETTYQFYFGNSIADNNEGNKYKNLSYVFSTGSYLDSLEIKGNIYAAREIDYSKTVVALYADSLNFDNPTFFTHQPKYLTTADSLGNYNLNYLAKGKYRMMAFLDETPDFNFDASKEMVAFSNELIDAEAKEASIKLKLMKQEPIYKAIATKQAGYGSIGVKIDAKPENLEITFTEDQIKDFHIEQNKDSITIWFDPAKQSFSEEKTTSIQVLAKNKEQTDTLKTNYYQQKKPELVLKPKDFDKSILSDYVLLSNVPVEFINLDSVFVYKDSTVVKFEIKLDQSKKSIIFDFKKEWGRKYEVKLNPGAIHDYFGTKNDSIAYTLYTEREQNFGTLELNWKTKIEVPFFLELKKISDKEIYKSNYITNEKTLSYDNLTPGKYEITIKLDEDKDGMWKSGNISQLRQAETEILLPDEIEIRPLWQVKQEIEF